MSERAEAIREAIRAFRRGELDAGELASWADTELDALLSDETRRYTFTDDVVVEVLGLLASCAATPDAPAEVTDALGLLDGDEPFHASRLLILDPAWIERSPVAGAVHAVSSAGQSVERGEPWERVVSESGADVLAAAASGGADDYVGLLLAEAGALVHDLQRAHEGEVELLGPGRQRMDASLLAERLASIGQVLRGERPVRATLVAQGDGAVRAVVSY